MTTWQKGAPPSIGWWPASIRKNRRTIRWWNGIVWSYHVWPENTKKEAADAANEAGVCQNLIKWTDRWWL